ncbi:MAG: hypothetical protein GY799_27910, partial [Desulfobulbaceae bacterium]|nr:hypothetical protein [Desulfobulbaceae bacterium]
MPKTMTDGLMEALFSSDGDMMDFDIWEGMQKLALDLLLSKAIMVPKQRKREMTPPQLWNDADSLSVFTYEHRNKTMLRNLGNVGFQTYKNSVHFATIGTDDPDTFLGHCRSLFAIPRSRYLSRRNLTKCTQRPDESVRSFTAELRKLVTYCDYPADQSDERLKENLIINTYSNEIRRKLFALPDATSLNDIIKQMEMLEQAARESKLTGNSAIGRTPPSTARLQAAQRGSRYLDFGDNFNKSGDDYASEFGERSDDFESDESANSSDSDVLQKISSLSNQLAKLQTSVERKNR